MIYVLESAGFNEQGNLMRLIKIGYTDNWERRFTQYKLHNPTIKTLYLYEGGNEDDEKSLHSYFSEYRYKGYGNEWFYYSEKLIKFFEENKTICDIENNIIIYRKHSNRGVNKLYNNILNLYGCYINAAINIIFQNNPNEDPSKFKELRNCDSLPSIRNWFKKSYSTIYDKIDEFSLKMYNFSKSNIKINSIISSFYNYATFTDKMKYICDQKKLLTEDEFNIILDLIPIDYKNYIVTLGVSRCSANSYNKSKLEKELELIISNRKIQSLLEQKIFSTFEIGKKYSKFNIKEMIREIYSEINYKRAPKAVDLKEWFEVKSVLIDRKKPGFELIKKKENN